MEPNPYEATKFSSRQSSRETTIRRSLAIGALALIVLYGLALAWVVIMVRLTHK